MTEIELKAHVADPETTAAKIAEFALARGEVIKRDVYWKLGGEPAAESPVADRQMTVAAAATAGTMTVAIIAAALAVSGAGKMVVIVLCLAASVLSALAALLVPILSIRNPRPGRAGSSPASGGTPLKVRLREEIPVVPGDAEEPRAIVTYKRKEIRGDTEVNDEREFSIEGRAEFEALLRDIGFSEAIRKEKRTRGFSWKADGGTEVTLELSLVAGLGWFLEIEVLADNPGPTETLRAQRLLREALAKAGVGESAIETRYYTDMLAEARAASERDRQFPKK